MKPYKVGSFNFFTPDIDDLEEALRESRGEVPFEEPKVEEVLEEKVPAGEEEPEEPEFTLEPTEGETLERVARRARPIGSFKEMSSGDWEALLQSVHQLIGDEETGGRVQIGNGYWFDQVSPSPEDINDDERAMTGRNVTNFADNADATKVPRVVMDEKVKYCNVWTGIADCMTARRNVDVTGNDLDRGLGISD